MIISPLWQDDAPTIKIWMRVPLAFPFCISHGLNAALNSTEQMHFPQTQVPKDTVTQWIASLQPCWKEALFKLARARSRTHPRIKITI